jgi:nucleoside-diphosphate-sugar epimerase
MDTQFEKPVLVTGASGYLAGWIIRRLLEEGVTVHGTVRSYKKPEKYAWLTDMAAELPGELKLFEANLLENGSFAEAMEGCGVVMHTASPYVVQGVKDGLKELVEPALQGTRNVLNSVNETNSVHTVVLTSSVVAMYGDSKDVVERGGVLNESMWNESSSIDHQPYPYSKTVAEREAWKYRKGSEGEGSNAGKWTLKVINPGFILGPPLQNKPGGTSVEFIQQIVDGSLKTGAPDLHFAIVDVREVAEAHLNAASSQVEEGRFLLSAGEMNLLEIAENLRAYKPGFKYPKSKVPKFIVWLLAPTLGLSRKYISRNVGYAFQADNSRSREVLEIKYRAISSTLQDMLDRLIEVGAVKA